MVFDEMSERVACLGVNLVRWLCELLNSNLEDSSIYRAKLEPLGCLLVKLGGVRCKSTLKKQHKC
ncbi:hypothetical protein CsSME_00011666 [Camellia sinensis var. sinensis]